MKSPVFSKSVPACVLIALGLVVSVTALAANPEQRPALLGSGPKSLVNLIDANALMQKGQGDAWVMFEGVIAGDSFRPSEFTMFSPNSERLRAEVRRRLTQAKFVSAVYKGRNAYCYFCGTVLFVVRDGHPHVRVFANQDLDEIKRGADFIAPQVVALPGQAGINNWPSSPSASFRTGGVVKLRHSVSAEGKTLSIQVMSTQPNDQAMGETAAKMASMLDYLPPYRNGRPVTASFTETWMFGFTRPW